MPRVGDGVAVRAILAGLQAGKIDLVQFSCELKVLRIGALRIVGRECLKYGKTHEKYLEFIRAEIATRACLPLLGAAR